MNYQTKINWIIVFFWFSELHGKRKSHKKKTGIDIPSQTFITALDFNLTSPHSSLKTSNIFVCMLYRQLHIWLSLNIVPKSRTFLVQKKCLIPIYSIKRRDSLDRLTKRCVVVLFYTLCEVFLLLLLPSIKSLVFLKQPAE